MKNCDILKIENNLKEVLNILGINLHDENYKETPKRLAEYLYEFTEFTRGGEALLDEHFEIAFPQHNQENIGYENIVFQSEVEVFSLCSHHLIPIIYNISFAYIPEKNLQIGFSKIIRILKIIAKNPSNQEDFTQSVINIFSAKFKCKGVAILVSGTHLCMKVRGVNSAAVNKTFAMSGVFNEDKELRDRFFELTKM